MRTLVRSPAGRIQEAGFPASLSKPYLANPSDSPRRPPPARRQYSQDAGDGRSSGSDAVAGATHTETPPASTPPDASPSAPPRLGLTGKLEGYYLFMGCPSRPGTALCQLNRTVIQSPNGTCSAQGLSVIMSHADKKNTAFGATSESYVLTAGTVRGHHLLCLDVSPSPPHPEHSP